MSPSIPRVFAAMLLALAVGAHAQHPSAASDDKTSVYEPFRFLIGKWQLAGADQVPMGVARFQWGTGQSYLWHSVATLEAGVEVPHYEGMLLWNASTHNLDMLLALDLNGGRVQESGPISVAEDGTVTRDITATSPKGKQHFRQTFKPMGPDRVETSAMRETAEGWVATFPGSDHLVMTRVPDDSRPAH